MPLIARLLPVLLSCLCGAAMAAAAPVLGTGATFPAQVYGSWAQAFAKENTNLIMGERAAGSFRQQMGKLFAEVIENIDMKPVEGIAATGAPWHVSIRFGALPQVLSNFVSYGLLRFEINVRESAVLGFVGAGGIGMDLFEAIRKFYYSDVSAILVMIIITVAIIDVLTGVIRHRVIGLVERGG